jgi:hypothetical protein
VVQAEERVLHDIFRTSPVADEKDGEPDKTERMLGVERRHLGCRARWQPCVCDVHVPVTP